MKRWSLRLRATAAASLAILLSLAVVAAGVDVLIARHLRHGLDATLRTRAVEIAQLSASAPAVLTTPGALDSSVAGGAQVFVQVVDQRGRLVARSLSLGGRVLPVKHVVSRVIRTGRGTFANVRLGRGVVRVYAAPLADLPGRAGGGAVAVASSPADIADTVATLQAVSVAASVVAALIGAAAVWLLIRRALRPLASLVAVAREIESTGDARRRLPEPSGADEVGQLAMTLNRMLASLQNGRERERAFLADASHELRTPLTALRGNVEYLAHHGSTPEVVADLQHDAIRLARLADDLLVLSREESSQGVSDIVRLDDLARAIPDVEVVAPQPVSVRGEAAALERALANLVENARRHGPPGGRVTVSAEETDGVARLSVEDEGRGLQPYEVERAFKRFWRRSNEAPGSGLGLAIVVATAERHGGRVVVDGSKFTIELPPLRNLSENAGTRE